MNWGKSLRAQHPKFSMRLVEVRKGKLEQGKEAALLVALVP